eukprot:COSAG02_NODE_265_length_26599_cov_13.943698_1_plen_298_part_10
MYAGLQERGDGKAFWLLLSASHGEVAGSPGCAAGLRHHGEPRCAQLCLTAACPFAPSSRVSACGTGQFNFATCGDKDGDGPGTEAVSTADCNAFYLENEHDMDHYAWHRQQPRNYIARAGSFDAVLVGAEWNPTDWHSDFEACCEPGYEKCRAAYYRGETCPEGMAIYYNEWEYYDCPEKPCNLTLGSTDVDVCCSEPRCYLHGATPGYVVSTDWAEGTASELAAFVECADGYTGAPNVTCSADSEDHYGYADSRHVELGGCEAAFNFATCGDKDGDGPGTEAVSTADCNAFYLENEH